MKIQADHYRKLEEACREVVTRCPDSAAKYAAEGLSDMRYRWDILHAARIDDAPADKFVCDVLYAYLSDNHIDTALRAIIHNLKD